MLSTKSLFIAYKEKMIVEDLHIEIPGGRITSIIGPNGSGKSTILKTIARIMKPKSGVIYLDSKAIHEQSTKEIAKKMAILPQHPSAPEGLTVYELVSYGRSPHQKGFGSQTKEDRKMVRWAIHTTGVASFANRPVDSLSGGQRQKVWIAMALAQGTDLLLLDEPTSFLDLAHQLEVLELLERLNKTKSITIVMVLHDLNLASRFSDNMVAVDGGKVIKEGNPDDVMTREVLQKAFNIDVEIVTDPEIGKPVCLTYDLLTDT
ncbi:ABC transporter ATP-binding protein [Bacillus sp. P14.5]|uniref:ABC transporter ATP-binding protein n=1 Tax=Bacillus sp. P14.5 TaxID=1983400 RepID=UPI000DE8D19A|nr:ABC transporter ATP-binding protein [Bacillus sp. P14.5]